MPHSEIKKCQNCAQEFTIEPDDFTFYQKIQVPPPTFCPECRVIRRMLFWNERLLFRKKEAREGKEIFSSYPDAAPVKIYHHEYWWSDQWDPMEYGREYDFSRPFFSQFKDLINAVPWIGQSVNNMENSDYCNQSGRLKNCYLCFNMDESEGCAYGVAAKFMKGSMDFRAAISSEFCYEAYQIGRCYQSFFVEECHDCIDVVLSYNCRNCSNCFGCVNLKHKRYHIFNEPHTKEEYEKKIKEFNLGSYRALEGLRRQFKEFRKKFPVKYIHSIQSHNVSGDYVYYSKNAKYCFEVGGVEDSKYCHNLAPATKDSYDYTNWGNNVELMYEAVDCGTNSRTIKFCFEVGLGCHDLEYSMSCVGSSHLFGCSNVRAKQYCILNRQYTKEEYETLVPRIRRHMNEMPYRDARGKIYRYGEFFPPEFSPLAYNETVAQDYYPLTAETALRRGYLWRPFDRREYATTTAARDLPDHIRDVPEDITREKIACDSCGRAYQIISSELEFYKRFTLPLPRFCSDCRYRERIKWRNPLRWQKRRCACGHEQQGYHNNAAHFHGTDPCPNEFETSYAPDRPEIVYCEACYNSEVV